MEKDLLFSLIGAIAVTALITGLAVAFRFQFVVARLREKQAALQATLEAERQAYTEKIAELENVRQKLSETFSALSSTALKNNSEEFLKLARENLQQFHIQAQSDLSQREKSIENLVKPIKETLEKTEKQIRTIEQERKEAYGALTQHLNSMAQTQTALQSETRNLVNALRRPEVRGQWGELTLKRLVELAGMVQHCDFYEQQHTTTSDGALRPDMIVRMPGNREIVVDIKTPLDAYLSAVEAPGHAERDSALTRHAKNVRERVRELSTKAYWSQFSKSPDFVVLFIPGDQFLSAALDQDHELLEFAMQQKVILATPTSFVALLRAVAYGWRQEALTQNAEIIRELGSELSHRLATFSEHLGKLGRSLTGSVQHFNKAVGAFDSRLLPSARKFSEMGITTSKPIEPLNQIETTARAVENSEEKNVEEDAVY